MSLGKFHTALIKHHFGSSRTGLGARLLSASQGKLSPLGPNGVLSPYLHKPRIKVLPELGLLLKPTAQGGVARFLHS